MEAYDNNNRRSRKDGIIGRHPLLANIVIIIIVAALGLVIAYLSLALFTKHGQTDIVPRVVNASYASAVEKLHNAGFKVEIRDSLYLDNVKPGLVIEQFPAAGAVVKPGRKIFLYINAVHPKEVVIDPMGDSRLPALRGLSMRQARAQLEELGFKKIKIVYILGDTDRVLKISANGKPVYKLQKVPVNASIVMEVYDGRKSALTDSLQNAEYARQLTYSPDDYITEPEEPADREETPAEEEEIIIEEELSAASGSME